MTVDLDDVGAIRDQDAGGMLAAVAALGSHCREGYSNGTGATGLPDLADVRSVVFCGMGGSAVAGDVLRSVFRDRLGVPVEVNRSPELPEHAGPHSLVVASSYSGNTSETLAAFREATKRGCRAIVVSSGGTIVDEAGEAGVPVVRVPGGFQPRAALGWLAFTSLGALEAAGLLPPLAEDIAEAAGEVDARAAACGPETPARDNPAKVLAETIGERIPVIWGAEGIGAVAAARWKTQCNENGKVPAWWASMSELDHNEVVGWTEPFGRAHTVIALRHETEDPETAARFPLSLQIAADAGADTNEVWATGRSALARLMSLIALGDFTSAYIGVRKGVDPTPVDVIQRLKAALVS
ncbi:MAG TPA: bifunctional phosphoglucose/phosphomannose isomerase [Actinomycetota bacterium]|nr:bifunctional phosphoglucose/phosphomannose isomerase [Actinomycetota bacterium]